MPRISLRTYEKGIEELIEQNKLNEAIAHCKQILQFFPKNISTYRILGKAFLEGKQYKETADIFSRVLTVFPDDFIAHAGMSIVRESEKNLDAAIWHMQLAFDSQPSNIAIQEELKRLFDLRDGTHPDKIRLTRGALVRMYARGELYQQAIDEIKSALIEEPKRIDLQVFLAKMYFLSGDQEEALTSCENLIKELPYCFELNRILVNILTSSGNANKASVFLARLKELNPYQSYVNEIYNSEDQVPDEKVMIDKLADVPQNGIPFESNWLSTIQTDWQETNNPVKADPSIEKAIELSTEDDFLKELTQPSQESVLPQEVSTMNSPTDPINQDDAVQPNPEEAIPDWMRKSGWVPSGDESSTPPENEQPIAEQPSESEALAADIPEWLKSISQEQAAPAPENIDDSSEEKTNLTAASETSEWMNEVMEENSPQKTESETELPDWLKNFETEDKVEPVTKDDLPDWLNSLKGDVVKPISANPFVELTDQEATPIQQEVPSEEPSAQTPSQAEPQENEPTDLNPEKTLWQPAEEAISPETVLPAETEKDPDSAISKETEDDLLNWLRDLKPLDTSEELPADSLGKVPEESLDNEDQRYDFAAQLERLQQMSANPDEKLESSSVDDLASTSESGESVEETVAESQPEEVAPAIEETETTPEFVNETQPEDTPTQEISPETIQPKTEESAKGQEPEMELLKEEPISSSDRIEEPKPNPEPLLPVEESQNEEIEPIVQPVEAEPPLAELQAQTEINPQDYLAWQKLGDVYASSGDLSNALSAYNKAEEILLNSK